MQRYITALLADSHHMVAGSLCRDLDQENDISVVALAGSRIQATEAAIKHQPQVAVIDTELDGGGMKACQQIVVACPITAVLILSPFDRDIYLAQAWSAGAVGLITKCDTLDDLLGIVRQARRGRPLFTSEQLYRIQRWQQHIAPRLEALTSREWDVLRLIVQGHSNREISDTLSLAESTVAKHITALLQKTEMNSRHALISFANQQHIAHYTQPPSSFRSNIVGI